MALLRISKKLGIFQNSETLNETILRNFIIKIKIAQENLKMDLLRAKTLENEGLNLNETEFFVNIDHHMP